MNSSYINFNKSMAQVIIAENVNSPNEETYKNTIEMVGVNNINCCKSCTNLAII